MKFQPAKINLTNIGALFLNLYTQKLQLSENNISCISCSHTLPIIAFKHITHLQTNPNDKLNLLNHFLIPILNSENRVGGKRSSFLPTFVLRPFTPPYVPFGIRRFFTIDAFRRIRKTLPRHHPQPSICRSALLYTVRIPSYLFKGSPILFCLGFMHSFQQTVVFSSVV